MPRRAIIRTVSATALALGALLAGALVTGPAVAAPVTTAMPATAAPVVAAPVAAAPVVAAPAAAALADCCQLRVNGLPGQMVAGANPVSFVVTFTNTSQQVIASSMRMTFTFNGAGQLNTSSVIVKRRRANGDWQGINISHNNGKLVGTDNIRIFSQNMIPPGGSTQFQYQMSWGSKVPSVQVSLDLAISGRLGGNHNGDSQELASSGGHQFVVTGSVPLPTQKPTQTPSAPPSTPSTDSTAAPQTPGNLGVPSAPAVIPQSDASGGGSGVVWIAYIIGALLLLGGIGVIGYMLWRRGPQMIETEWDEEQPPGYQAGRRTSPQHPLPGSGYGQRYDAPTVHGEIEVLPQPRTGRHGRHSSVDPTREYDPR